MVPEVEWWDASIMPNMKYETFLELSEQEKPNHLQGLTSLIEHPIQHHPPGRYTRGVRWVYKRDQVGINEGQMGVHNGSSWYRRVSGGYTQGSK